MSVLNYQTVSLQIISASLLCLVFKQVKLKSHIITIKLQLHYYFDSWSPENFLQLLKIRLDGPKMNFTELLQPYFYRLDHARPVKKNQSTEDK